MVTYDLKEICFSAPGSFLALKSNADGSRLIYCTTARKAMSEKWMDFWAANFFELVLVQDGVEVPYTWIAYPHRLDVTAGNGGTATFAFADGCTILFELHGVGLSLSALKPYKTQYRDRNGELCLVDAGTHYLHQFTCTSYSALTAPQVGTIEFAADQSGAFRWLRFEEIWHYRSTSVDQAAFQYAVHFEQWRHALQPVPELYRGTAEKALLLLWNCEVPISGSLSRRAIFSSKSWMNSVWSWDNCFHALAIAPMDAQLAWDQLLLVFDHQSPAGALPDVIHDGG
ncbi:MGH1-like glycoside hydrolase domain-containing protein [Dictyobacter kobayashii]|uniref:Mannosylglycerate hydrolase MGH1-like glycoside hydrolase domain-containing protein n=1 Tax=Dictyobacter kobayashii TaxID=2014872 RepID=A0A402AJ27_9CHLR|nr:hypothetical protein [Dictyobacter kobayashii]GCE19060.1 hypothetical protein KDK_28600 [Dictyobacter kobayashii]